VKRRTEIRAEKQPFGRLLVPYTPSMAIPGLDPDVQQFVERHIYIVASQAVTVLLAGIAVGRFWLDRLVPILRAQAEEFKNQRDEARLQVQQANLRVQQTGNGREKDIEAQKETSRSRAVGRFFSAIATVLVIAMLGYNIYQQSLIRSLAQAEASRNADFQIQTAVSLKAIQPKPAPPPKPPVAPARKRTPSERTTQPDATNNQK
jgi:hypothetical protein